MIPRAVALAGLTLALVLGARVARPDVAARAGLPDRLTDQEFWHLTEDFSEPDGFFRSDNLVSNEDTFQGVIPRLMTIVKPGGVYFGVGPDQNFTYIVALQPRIAFITDIRRGNLQEHLMYKALLELSADRADFLSRLFSRPRPEGLGAATTPEALFAAYARVDPSANLYNETWHAMTDVLVKRHGFPLSADDLAGIEFVFGCFRSAGPYLAYGGIGAPPPAGGRAFAFAGRAARYPTYQDLQLATDDQGKNRAYLGSEENYRALKLFEERNLLVPLVGDFAGPKALRAAGAWVKSHGATVTTFYLSNVEQYLFGDGIWGTFAQNIADLPLDGSSTFIRSCFSNCGPTRAVMQLDSMTSVVKDFGEGKIRTYVDLLSHVR